MKNIQSTPSPQRSVAKLVGDGREGSLFELTEIDPTALIRDLVKGLAEEGLLPTASTGSRPAVYVRTLGCQRRVLPDETVAAAGLRTGDHLRIVPVPEPTSLVQLYEAAVSTLRVDALRAGLPQGVVGIPLEPAVLVRRVIDELDRRSALPELFVLAGLRWREDEELRAALRALAAAAELPADVAPDAWIGLLPEQQDELTRLWAELRAEGAG